MDRENGRPPDPDEIPGEVKTVNQIVAWNTAYFRRAAGLTQEQLGALTGRSQVPLGPPVEPAKFRRSPPCRPLARKGGSRAGHL